MTLLDCVAIFVALLIIHISSVSPTFALLIAVGVMGVLRLLGYHTWPAKSA